MCLSVAAVVVFLLYCGFVGWLIFGCACEVCECMLRAFGCRIDVFFCLCCVALSLNCIV